MLVDDIENAVRSILETPLATLHSYRIKPEVGGGSSYTGLTVTCQVDESELTRTKVLTVAILEEDKQIQIPTLFMPTPLRGHKLAFRVLHEIFNIGRQHGYDLFIVDMVESFHRKMLSLGAYEIDQDTVQITPTTRLI
jgi:hypothetical protein